MLFYKVVLKDYKGNLRVELTEEYKVNLEALTINLFTQFTHNRKRYTSCSTINIDDCKEIYIYDLYGKVDYSYVEKQ